MLDGILKLLGYDAGRVRRIRAERQQALRGQIVAVRDQNRREQEMRQRERMVAIELGFELGNATQNWMHLHELLLDYRQRIERLEAQVRTLTEAKE